MDSTTKQTKEDREVLERQDGMTNSGLIYDDNERCAMLIRTGRARWLMVHDGYNEWLRTIEIASVDRLTLRARTDADETAIRRLELADLAERALAAGDLATALDAASAI